MNQPQTICIIGLGLIGSSVARGLHELKDRPRIYALDRNPLSVTYAVEHGFVNDGGGMADIIPQCDIIMLCVPPSALSGTCDDIAPHIKQGAIITDVASVKTPAIDAVLAHLPTHAHFIPGHPIAGSEQSGVAAGKADLFTGKRVILTPPTPGVPGLEEVTVLWKSLGALVEYMPPAMHDRIYAFVSHLPQFLAFAYRDAFPVHPEIDTDAFRAFTRLTRSPDAMWAEIFAANASNVRDAVTLYMQMLTQIRGELESGGNEHEDTGELGMIQAAVALLPRIIASCLIGTVAREQREHGAPLARYSGTGFADFTAPAHSDPENDLAAISANAKATLEALDVFSNVLNNLTLSLKGGGQFS